jgi:hypothetical protein
MRKECGEISPKDTENIFINSPIKTGHLILSPCFNNRRRHHRKKEMNRGGTQPSFSEVPKTKMG